MAAARHEDGSTVYGVMLNWPEDQFEQLRAASPGSATGGIAESQSAVDFGLEQNWPEDQFVQPGAASPGSATGGKRDDLCMFAVTMHPREIRSVSLSSLSCLTSEELARNQFVLLHACSALWF